MSLGSVRRRFRSRLTRVGVAGLVTSAALAVFLLSTVLFSTPASTQEPTHAELKQQCYEGGAAWRGQDGMAEDCATLLGLMDELRGTGTLNWSATRSMTQWDGATLRGTHLRLQTLRLTKKGLNGTIPAAMGQLTGLRGLYMSFNDLSGTIPDELGQIKGLRYLYLSENRLTGQIPLSIEHLPFRRIGLSGNSFSGCLPAGLRDVGINDWNFLQLNDCPADAVTLRVSGAAGGTLSVSDGAHVYARNAVVTVRARPASGHRVLDWGDDCAAVLPTSTSCRLTMDADKTVSIAYKQRPTGPRCLGPGRTAIADPTNLGLVDDCKVLWGLKGQLRGTAPLNWDSRLPITEWEGITLGGTPLRVTKVELATHGLTGSISPKLGELEELETLNLTWNKLGGSIPAELGKLTSLTDLLLFRNNFTGSIPPELGNLANLRFLSLSQNYLSGSIPAELADLAQLQALHLYQNRLTGQIPPELQDLEHLTAISLSENSFSGCIPKALLSIANHDLDRLTISECRPPSTLTIRVGPNGATNPTPGQHSLAHGSRVTLTAIPSVGYFVDSWGGDCADASAGATCSLTMDRDRVVVVEFAALGPCATGGAVPNAARDVDLMRDCERLLELRDVLVGTGALNWNSNTAITSWTGVTVGGSPPRVTRLRLSNRGLTGELSGLLGTLTGLRELRLDRNQLTGRIPSKLTQLIDLTHVYLRGNTLTGCIPPSLWDAANHDIAALGLPTCGAPSDASRVEDTIGEGTYKLALREGSPALVFDIPSGLQLEIIGIVVSDAGPEGADFIGLILEVPTGGSWLCLDLERGEQCGRRIDPNSQGAAGQSTTTTPETSELFDRIAESLWMEEGQ